MGDEVADKIIAESIAAASQKLEVDNNIPLKDYYELADDLLKQAGTHRKEKNFVDLYTTLLRFQRLVMDTIPSHQDYMSKHRKQRHEFWKKGNYVVNELKSLKADGKCPIDELKTIPDVMDLVTNVRNLDATPLENLSANQVRGDVDESIATSTSHSLDRRNVELDGAVSGCPSELDRTEVCPEGETSVQLTDNQSLKKEPELENANLHSEELLSPVSRECEVKDEKVVYVQLQHAIADIATLKQELYKETCELQKAEKNAIEASYNAVKHEKLYVREMRRRIKAEDVLLELVLKLENLKYKNGVFDVLQERNEILETTISELQDKLSAMEQLVNSFQAERDDALRKTQEIRGDETHINTIKGPNVLEFSYLELDQATDNFVSSMKIMQNSHGNVYKGTIRNMMVAIKTPAPEFRLPQPVFLQEVTAISFLRHPNLVNLLGMCTDSQSLIYEFLPNGSLEDHLDGGGDCSLLSWQVRISILADICSTLIFLHSCGMIHGNLKPSNILFDDHFFCKICDFRICHQGCNSAFAYHNNLLIKSPYMDPEFQSTGNVTIKSDIYSFGVIILQLLTGRPAYGIVEEVGFAIGKENVDKILDKSAGEWPFVQARQLLHLGLRCCETYSSDRPDLASDAWKVLEPMRRASSSCSMSVLPWRAEDIPSYFLCPILQEIMTDPCVAVDGFTYDAEALKAWLNGGHDTSPMTNMKLSSKELIPNRALRSSIHEWRLKRGKEH